MPIARSADDAVHAPLMPCLMDRTQPFVLPCSEPVLHPGLPLLRDLIDPERPLWTPSELRALTRTVAAALTVPLMEMVRFDREQRWWTRFALTGGVELWLLSWAPGQDTGPHDHSGARGSFTVLLGELTEDYTEGYHGGPSRSALHRVGAAVGFGPNRAHRVRNLGTGGAVSVHAYSPPHLPTRRYARLADGPAGATPQLPTGRGAPMTADGLLMQARAELSRIGPYQADQMRRHGALIVDLRPYANRAAEGEIPGAVPVERIVLEWRLDPAGPHRLPCLTVDTQVVLVCNEGYASSLAARDVRRLGLHATDLIGGFRAWKAAGLPVVPAAAPQCPDGTIDGATDARLELRDSALYLG